MEILLAFLLIFIVIPLTTIYLVIKLIGWMFGKVVVKVKVD